MHFNIRTPRWILTFDAISVLWITWIWLLNFTWIQISKLNIDKINIGSRMKLTGKHRKLYIDKCVVDATQIFGKNSKSDGNEQSKQLYPKVITSTHNICIALLKYLLSKNIWVISLCVISQQQTQFNNSILTLKKLINQNHCTNWQEFALFLSNFDSSSKRNWQLVFTELVYYTSGRGVQGSL